MKFRVRFRPTGAADWPELIDIFDLPIEETHYQDKIEQQKQDLQAAYTYLKRIWMAADIISIEKLY